MSSDDLDGGDREIIDHVAKSGCFIQYVFDAEGVEPGFGYSVGFTTTVRQPEVIVLGLPFDVVCFMINETLAQCRRGLRLNDWGEVDGLLEGHRCILRSVRPEAIEPEFFSSAMWYHQREFGSSLDAAFQIVWPGTINGLFPWDKGCSPDVIEAQPRFYSQRFH